MRAPLPQYFLLSLSSVAVALLFGRTINRQMTGHSFLRLVYVGLMVVGSVPVVQVIAG